MPKQVGMHTIPSGIITYIYNLYIYIHNQCLLGSHGFNMMPSSKTWTIHTWGHILTHWFSLSTIIINCKTQQHTIPFGIITYIYIYIYICVCNQCLLGIHGINMKPFSKTWMIHTWAHILTHWFSLHTIMINCNTPQAHEVTNSKQQP